MHYITSILLLWLVYLALTGNLAWNNLVVGLLFAAAVTLLMRPRRRAMNIRRFPAAFFAMLRYVGILMWDIVVNGIQVARIVLTPSLPIQPGIIAIPSLCESELGTALSAHAITVSPGELVVEISEDGVMYTHTLDATNSEKKAADAQRLRVNLLQKIFP
jgi:multicomponent Na+:H+ antiporter subunit E